MTATRDARLQALHDENAAPLLRYVTWLTHDFSLAQDIVQETLLRAWKNPKILDADAGSARAWLFTVARNLVIDERRSARSRHEFQPEQLPESPSDDDIGRHLDTWLLSDALRSLSVEHRNAVISAYYLGNSAAETARREGIPEGTARSRVFYALRALRLALQERGVSE